MSRRHCTCHALETDLPLTLDSYVFSRAQIVSGRARNRSGIFVRDIHERLYLSFATKVALLVDVAKANPDADADGAQVADADQYRCALEGILQFWTSTSPRDRVTLHDGTTFETSAWDHYNRMNPWQPADGVLQGKQWWNQDFSFWFLASEPVLAPGPIQLELLLQNFGGERRPRPQPVTQQTILEWERRWGQRWRGQLWHQQWQQQVEDEGEPQRRLIWLGYLWGGQQLIEQPQEEQQQGQLVLRPGGPSQ